MRRTDWRTNPGAVGVALVGVLLLAWAVSLYGSGVYLNDVESCASIAAAAMDSARNAAPCAVQRVARVDTVRNLGIAAVVLVGVALLTATRRWLYVGEERPASWTAPLWALAVPIFPFAALSYSYSRGILLDTEAAAVASGVAVAWWCASVLRGPETRAHLLTAAAVALPVICTGVAGIGAYLDRSPNRPWRVQNADFSTSHEWLLFLVPVIGTAALFAIGVVLARAGRAAPNIWFGGLLFAASAAVMLPVFVPDLVPSWRGFDNTPGPAVWLPILLAPALLAALVWAACAARRVREPEPAAFS